MADPRNAPDIPSYETCIQHAAEYLELADNVMDGPDSVLFATKATAWATLAIAVRDHRSYP